MRSYNVLMDTTTKGQAMIIEAPHYQEDAERIAIAPVTIAMFIELPAGIRAQLAAKEHMPGFMEAANAEWRRRNEVSSYRVDSPGSLGTVLRALQILAEC